MLLKKKIQNIFIFMVDNLFHFANFLILINYGLFFLSMIYAERMRKIAGITVVFSAKISQLEIDRAFHN